MNLDPTTPKAQEAGEIARVLVTLRSEAAPGEDNPELKDEIARLVTRDDPEMWASVVLALSTYVEAATTLLVKAAYENPTAAQYEKVRSLAAARFAQLSTPR